MTRISKKPIKDIILIRMYDLFFQLMMRSKNKKVFSSVMEDLLSPTEKVMIAKRLAIIYLLIKNIDHRTIAATLKVSTGTVARYAILFYKKDTDIVSQIKAMLIHEKALDFIEDIFANLLIEPGIKRGHWSKYHEYKIKKERKIFTGL